MNDIFNKEWLVTNGLGGYASGTVVGANTRRYHGLLVASENPPTDRRIVVAKIEERVFQQDTYFDLSANQFPGVVYPKGYEYLHSFERIPLPCWQYKTENWHLEKTIFMVYGSNATVVEYSNKGDRPFRLEAHPLFADYEYHQGFRENGFYDYYTEPQEHRLKIYPHFQGKPIFMRWSKGDFIQARNWYKNIQWPMEAYRGYDAVADYYRIGYLTYDLKPGESLFMVFSTKELVGSRSPADLKEEELNRIKELKNISTENVFFNDLLTSADQFLVQRKSTGSETIIAGYHWFADWGRDTMIAMRGLTIAIGDKNASKSILTTFFKYLSEGMLPNRFPDREGDEIEYNTLDAPLWLFIAMYEYHQKFHDAAFIEGHLNDLEDILQHYINGTRYQIHVTDEGFLYGGQEGVQLTWMDAKVDGEVVTPRIGCPVEINALWYNALKAFDFFCQELSKGTPEEYLVLARKIKHNFKDHFVNGHGTLYDVVIPGGTPDNTFRPNQIYVASLPFSLVDMATERKIVQQVGEKLWTPFGLRSLAVDNENYKGHYRGNLWQRDHAYHQGTAWPFLLGEYYSALLKTNKNTEKAREKVVKELEPLRNHFYNENGIQAISEIFDGDGPHEGRGTIQQAWSVGAILKLYVDFKLYKVG